MTWLQLFYVAAASFGLALIRLLIMKFAPEAAVWGKVATVRGSPQYCPPGFVRNVALSILSKRKFASEGYRQFSKALDQPFALPTTWVPGNRVIVLPPSRIPMLARPDKTEDNEWTNIQGMLETTQLPYVIDDTDVYRNLLHFDVVRRKMAHKDMDRLAPVTAEEIRHSFDKIWGTDPQWRTVNGWEACGRIISGASQRVLVGLSMSRDEDMLEISRLYANSLLVGGAIINCFPPSMRWLAAPLIAMRTRRLQARYMKLLMPIVEERIRQWESGKEAGPDDFLQWMLPVCAKEPGQLDATRIALRLVSLLTPLVFAICYIFAHCVLDIHGSADRAATVAGLEEECRRVSAQHGGRLDSAAAVGRLHRVDSALRESMRFSDVQVLNVFRDVTAGELDVGGGLRVGPGVRMLFPTQNIHMDPDNYAEPQRFDAFRFSRPSEEKGDGDDAAAAAAQPRDLITTPTPTFLPFGYGRHACPGRWFAAQCMKQALAHLVLNYEVELVGPQVKRRALSNIMIPPTGAQLRIRWKGEK